MSQVSQQVSSNTEILITVSVIIPAFNRISYIQQALESVFAQQHPSLSAIECIVVDDGSSDGTFELLQGYQQQQKIVLLTHPNRANRGQSAALNLGLAKASGDFVCILDSDDYFAPNKFADQLEYLLQHPDVGMVYGKGEAVDAEGNFLFYTLPKNHSENGDPNNILLDCYIAIPGGAMVRKVVIDQVGGFDESFRAAQDHDMAIRLFEACKVVYLPQVAFSYRKHGDSISKNGLERRWQTGFTILQRAAKRYPYRAETLRKRRAVLNYHLGRTYLSQGRYIAALPCLLKSALADPVRAIKVLAGHKT